MQSALSTPQSKRVLPLTEPMGWCPNVSFRPFLPTYPIEVRDPLLLEERVLVKMSLSSSDWLMSFFDSEIVQQEAQALMRDFQELMRIGADYGKFDREGKRIFIDQWEALLERQRIFMKRMELSQDFLAQLQINQMQDMLGKMGITPSQMYDQMTHALERMKAEIH
ncbi:MAG: hypothetical protein OHK0012_20220 [Synechococcales cyanobacterium]